MPSISIPAVTVAVATATSAGVVTVTADNGALLFPGAWGWIYKTDGSASTKIKLLAISADNVTLKVRTFPNNADEYANGQQGGPHYTTTDLSAYNTGSALSFNIQSVPVDPNYVRRSLP